jgi:glycosyltransferase involved in cell wall biosynthesis
MRVALLSNFWYQRGGLETVMFGDASGLQARGHEVAGFAAAHPLNDPAPYSRHFPALTEHGDIGRGLGPVAKARAATRLFSNGEAVRGFEAFADEFQPDLVHQHGTSRQLSPSVLEAAHRRGLPVVLTLHDYSLRCPAGTLSRTDAPVCIAVSCAGHRYDRAVRFSCVHGSRSASALAAVELLVARALRRYERSVDRFVVPSAYMAAQMREAGLPGSRIVVLPNAVAGSDPPASPPGDTVVVLGRLVATKGMDTVIGAARLRPDVSFVIAGDGPERATLEASAADLPNVEFLGWVSGADLERVLLDAAAVVVPSTWPEPFGMVVLEAWRAARAVVVTDRGALPEIVRDGRDGLVVPASDPVALAEGLDRLLDDPRYRTELGLAGRQRVQRDFAINDHLDRLEDLYGGLIADAVSAT